MSGGGTGGHLYPGIAVAQELCRRHPRARIVFAGTGRGVERQTVRASGYEHVLVRSAGLKGKSLLARIRGISVLPASAWDAWRIVVGVAPQLVVGLGGYSAGAVTMVAACRGIPTLLLEQNALPGLTNRLLARIATAAAVSYDMTVEHFRGKGFVAGNPVRKEFWRTTPQRTPEAGVHLLVLGGSQGAHAINAAMIAAAPGLARSACPLMVTHQTGARDIQAVQRAYAEAGVAARVETYLEEMAVAMGEADFVVSRAGATTLAELAAVGRGGLLVPLPGAADGHQSVNAEVLVRAGAAELLPQEALTGESMAARILALAGDPARYREMGVAARGLGRPDAVKVIVDRGEQLMGYR